MASEEVADDKTTNTGDAAVPFDEGAEIFISDEPEVVAEKPVDTENARLLEQIRSQEEAIRRAEARGDEVSALKDGLKELGSVLRQPVLQEEQFDEESYKKKFNEEFYNDPYQFLHDFSLKKLGPEFQRLAGRQEEMLKRDIARDPARADTFAKYRTEIEQEFGGISSQERYSDPQAFERAHDRVVARHLNEIIEARVAEALAVGKEQREERPAESFSEVPSRVPPQGGVKKIRMTTAESRWAQVKGLDLRKANEILERKPELRRVING